MPLPKHHLRFQPYQDKVNGHFKEILSLYYEKEWSLMEICEKFNLPRARVERTLKDQGYQLRGLSNKTKRSIFKTKNVCLERYGVDNISKLDSNKKEKSKRNKLNTNNCGHSEKQKWMIYTF